RRGRNIPCFTSAAIGLRSRHFAPAQEAEQCPIARQSRRSNASYACAETRTKRGALPLPVWGEGWGEGVTGGSDRPEPRHPFLDVAKNEQPSPTRTRARPSSAL